MKIEFIYGGSFDPLHKGHVNLVKEVICYIKKITLGNAQGIYFRFLPCAIPALKKASISDFSTRSNKLKEVFNQYFLEQKIEMQVDERESIRTTKGGNKSYTIDSLKELQSENSSVIRYLLLGADNFNNLYRWKNYEELPNHCNLLVVNRPEINLIDWESKAISYGFKVKQAVTELLKAQTTGNCYYMEIPEVNISSSEIREKIKANQSVKEWLV